MNTINNIQEAFNLTDKEIVDYLKEYWDMDSFVFAGDYDGEKFVKVRSGINRLKYPILNSPLFFKLSNPRFVTGERYTFICKLAKREFREKISNPFCLSIIPNSVKPFTQSVPTLSSSNEDNVEISRIKKRLRLDNNFFIGQFMPGPKAGTYRISDIRNTDFTKIEDKERGVKDLTIWFNSPHKEFFKYSYYKFTWVLLESSPLKFGIDLRKDVTLLYSKDIVSCLHNSIIHFSANAARKITRTLDTLNKQLTQSGKEVFIYELLQNANDYPRKTKYGDTSISLPVDVEFHITNDYLIFQHTGEYFNAKNIAAICDINDGEKSDNVEAIGYKGIGFKTVFLDNDYVYLNTGTYSFRFDKYATDVINTPWQILPVWTDGRNVDQTVKNVFARHPNDLFRVKFALKPRDSRILTDRERKNNYIDLFSKVFETERVILFIPNIHKVSIYWGDSTTPEIERPKDSKKWCVSEPLVDKIPDFVREKINEVLTNNDSERIEGYEKIPEKYLNFYKTAVKFACRKEGRKLSPVEDAILYCYLPAKRASWGFKFLMNTDMLTNGERDDIEDIELNHEIAKIAGRQFYFWIKGLISSGEYEMESIFSLIPDFDDCKNKHSHYKVFIDEFKDEFEKLIKEMPFVPVVDKNGNHLYACINEIIDDKTEITKENVMSDADFISIMGLTDNYLPIQELRESPSFMSFLYEYSPSKLDIDFDKVKEKCSTDRFVKWLKKQDNNNRFLVHLLSKKKLDNFDKEDIFIENEGLLFPVNKLYYEFDEKCQEIPFLKPFVPHLSASTRQFLEGNKDWDAFVDEHFVDFDATKLIKNYIINDEDAIKVLDNIDNSIAFFKFVAAKEVSLTGIFDKIPHFDENGISHYGLNGLTFFYDDNSYELSKEVWLGNNVITILSHQYVDKDTSIKGVFETIGVETFNKSSFVIEKIVNDTTFKANINQAIDDDFDKNLSFVKYVFSEREALKKKDGQLKEYVLKCIDIKGEGHYLNSNDIRYFSQQSYQGNTTFSDNTSHIWLKEGMMFCLDNKYFSVFVQEEQKLLESFFRQSFGIKTFTNKSFFSDVVLGNKKELYSTLDDKEKLKAFINYLKRDEVDIFDGTIAYNDVKDIPILLSDDSVASRQFSPNLYLYNEAAIELNNHNWFPAGIVKVLFEIYSTGFSEKTLQLFDFKSFTLKPVLESVLGNIFFTRSIADISQNIDFWRYVKTNIKLIDSLDAFINVKFIAEGDLNADRIGSFLYISDAYQNDGIESLVKKYDENALFVSKAYLEDDTESNKQSWVKLFKKLNFKFDNKDILFKSVIPNLKDIQDDAVVSMMTKHLKDIKEEWNNISGKLMYLQVKSKTGGYLPLSSTLIVNTNDENVSEPFKSIALSNEIDSSIFTANREIILLVAGLFGTSCFLNSKQEWANAKLKDYIETIQTDVDRRETIHVDIIRELAVLCDNDFKFSDDLISKILFKTKGEVPEYLPISDMALGSAYKPSCDFEAYGVTDYKYISESYLSDNNKDTITAFFKSTTIHQVFSVTDIDKLSNKNFALYFWRECFTKKVEEYKKWIEQGQFNGKTCIPTEESIKKPEDLYSPELYHYAKCSPNWKESMPAKIVVDNIKDVLCRTIFMLLPFKKKLEFEDCLYYLLNARDPRDEEHGRRRDVIQWILESNNVSEEAVHNYREQETAKWRNGKGRLAHIAELYAIHPDAKQEREIFRGDEHVMQTGMFPYDAKDFERVCSILQIKCLTSDDFITTPINSYNETDVMLRTLKPKLLVLAAIENPEKYQSIYEGYAEIIEQYLFFVCDKIDVGYNDIHNDVERIFVNDNRLYYVNSWLHRRTYSKFCKTLKRLLDIGVYDEVCEDVFEDSIPVEECIEKYCSSLLYDKDFQAYLEKLYHGIVVEDEEIEVQNDGDYYTEALTEPDIEQIEKATENDNNQEQEEQSTDNDSGSYNNSTERQYETSSNTAEQPTHSNSQVKDTVDKAETENAQLNNNNPHGESTSEQTDNTITEEKPTSEHVGTERSSGSGSSSQGGYRKPSGEGYRARPFSEPEPFSKEDVRKFKSRAVARSLDEASASTIEIDQLNSILGSDMTAEEIADTNYLVRKRLFQDLNSRGSEFETEIQDEVEFIKSKKGGYRLKSGKYIHTCSAKFGILYISPSIWNKLRDDKCIVCVYRGKKASQFMYLKSIEDLLTWVDEDDILIKLTGEEKPDVVNELYSSVLEGKTGSAYTMIRIASNAIFDSVFEPIREDPNQEDSLDEL